MPTLENFLYRCILTRQYIIYLYDAVICLYDVGRERPALPARLTDTKKDSGIWPSCMHYLPRCNSVRGCHDTLQAQRR